MYIEEIINRFQNVKIVGNKQYQCSCPAHKDSKPSLSITEEDNKILMHCFAGCDNVDILKSVGLAEKDLFNNLETEKAKIVKEYIYTDENHAPLYKVVRFEPKNFMQSKWENGKWVWKMQNVRYVLYNLPKVINSEEIFFVEGEKDADNLNKIGLVATTTVGGASSFSKRAKEYVEFLKDKKVYIIPDNDDAGRKYAKNIQEALNGVAKDVKILRLETQIKNLNEKADISDVLVMYGKDKTLNIINSLKECYDFSIYSGKHINLRILKNILENLNISVKYNEITKETEVKGLPRQYSDETAAEILPAFLSELCIEYNIKYKEKDIKNELLLIAEENKYNPIQEMLTQNVWDKIDRFPILFEILGITNDELSKVFVRKWMYQTTMIVFNNQKNLFGTEGVLVLQGNQDVRQKLLY